jgi:hypothetical protein
VRAKVIALVLVGLVLLYAVLLGQRAWLLLTSGDPVGVALGAALLVVPVLVVAGVLREVRFGAQTERMGRALEAEGGLPPDDLPRTPGGRVVRAAADEAFARYRADADAAPDDWRAWFRLALAYDAAGDRRRARSAMRHAASLHAGSVGGGSLGAGAT